MMLRKMCKDLSESHMYCVGLCQEIAKLTFGVGFSYIDLVLLMPNES